MTPSVCYRDGWEGVLDVFILDFLGRSGKARFAVHRRGQMVPPSPLVIREAISPTARVQSDETREASDMDYAPLVPLAWSAVGILALVLLLKWM